MSATAPRKAGRPATGKTRAQLCCTVPPSLIEKARRLASKKGESLSQYVSRAIQNALLNEP